MTHFVRDVVDVERVARRVVAGRKPPGLRSGHTDDAPAGYAAFIGAVQHVPDVVVGVPRIGVERRLVFRAVVARRERIRRRIRENPRGRQVQADLHFALVDAGDTIDRRGDLRHGIRRARGGRIAIEELRVLTGHAEGEPVGSKLCAGGVQAEQDDRSVERRQVVLGGEHLVAVHIAVEWVSGGVRLPVADVLVWLIAGRIDEQHAPIRDQHGVKTGRRVIDTAGQCSIVNALDDVGVNVVVLRLELW